MRQFWIYAILLIGAGFLLEALVSHDPRVPYARFRSMAEQGQLAAVDIKGDAYIGHTKSGPAGGDPTVRTGRIAESEKDLLAELDKNNIPYTNLGDGRSPWSALVWVIPIGGALLIFYFLSSKKIPSPNVSNPALSFGKNRARLYVDKGQPITFRDVAGCHEAKIELEEIVHFLRSPERYRRLGGKIPKGVLLVGPPGTGKTLLARAVAGEANVPFYSICGSEFVEMFVGVGAARVRDLFAQAQEKPAGIIFIDELDAVGKARGSGGPIGGNDEREQTLNQLLTEMDGFDAKSGLIVLAATNRPEILDSALLRAGRFDRRVLIDRPDLNERREILKVHGDRVLLASSVDLDDIAGQTPGLVGADLANIINEAALLAARRHGQEVEQVDIEQAMDRVIGGLERPTRRLGERERRLVAYHESGHALMAELLPTQDPVRKISIIPRGLGALGYTMQQPREDRYLMSRCEILDRLVVLLGGRVAEELTVGDVSTGAQDDLSKASELARRMVRELGMSESLGVSTLEGRTMSDRMMSGGPVNDHSEATLRIVDDEVCRILDDARQRARRLMSDNRGLLERIAERLLAVETMSGAEVRNIISSVGSVKPAA